MASSTLSRPQLWLALRFHQLPLNLHGYRPDSEAAIAICERLQVSHFTEPARKQGVARGMARATVLALGDITLLERRPDEERNKLQALQDIGYRFTPYITVQEHPLEQDAGLLLEISRCLKLFRGLTPLCDELFAILHRHQLDFYSGYAHTRQGAWLLSAEAAPAQSTSDIEKRYQHEESSEDLRRYFSDSLNKLPVTLLQTHPKACESLLKTGFETLGDIEKQIDRSGLASLGKRFGKDFADYLADLYGIARNQKQQRLFTPPPPSYQPRQTFCQHIQFDYPVTRTDLLFNPMQSLLEKLQLFLRKHQLQAQSVHWHLCDIHHNKESLTITGTGLSGQHHDSRQLFELSRIQLENRELPFEVDLLELECGTLHSAEQRTPGLRFGDSHNPQASEDFELTLARLQSRLGDNAVYKVSFNDHHVPEKTNLRCEPEETSNQQLTAQQIRAPRPAWLLDKPSLIRQQKHSLWWQGELQLLQGPERIEGYWWDAPVARDYFIARREDELRLWIFYDLHEQIWFVHGVF